VNVVHVVVPAGIDDPARPSGGNVYDRRICAGLASAGWDVREHQVPGAWPLADSAAHTVLSRTVAELPDDAIVLVDGLIASAAPVALVPVSERVALVVLVHMPLGISPSASVDVFAGEAAVLSAATAVITTSSWTRDQLLGRYSLRPDRVYVAWPGADAAELAPGSAKANELLCVAAVTPDKGHDVLLAALASLVDLPWRCTCVGSLDRDRGFAGVMRCRAQADRIADRVGFPGTRTGAPLAATFAGADLLVLASRAETYGMVVTEALARGVPVVATDVGGVAEALGEAGAGGRPGLLVPPDDPAALSAALRRWLTDAGLRGTLRQAARHRRDHLPGWSDTSDRVNRVLGLARHEIAGQ
jgi:glycosyltransferase involved in cell wall biosynthesis